MQQNPRRPGFAAHGGISRRPGGLFTWRSVPWAGRNPRPPCCPQTSPVRALLPAPRSPRRTRRRCLHTPALRGLRDRGDCVEEDAAKGVESVVTDAAREVDGVVKDPAGEGESHGDGAARGEDGPEQPYGNGIQNAVTGASHEDGFGENAVLRGNGLGEDTARGADGLEPSVPVILGDSTATSSVRAKVRAQWLDHMSFSLEVQS